MPSTERRRSSRGGTSPKPRPAGETHIVVVGVAARQRTERPIVRRCHDQKQMYSEPLSVLCVKGEWDDVFRLVTRPTKAGRGIRDHRVRSPPAIGRAFRRSIVEILEREMLTMHRETAGPTRHI